MANISKQNSSPILFIHVAWMKRYRGHSEDDPVIPGGFGYFRKKGEPAKKGHEQFNFLPHRDGYVYGYIPRSSGLALERLGGKRRDESMDGVTVVWIAKDPSNGVHKVVGWYQEATVYRSVVYSMKRGKLNVPVSIEAPAEKATVLSVLDRTISIPTGKGGLGQSPVWYGEYFPEKLKQVRQFIESYSGASRGGRKPSRKASKKTAPRQQDVKKRLEIEQVAMDMAIIRFDAIDVSRKAKGWDLEAVLDGRKFLIEAKGLSGRDVRFELTPNEYEKMHHYKEQYVLFVVTSALTKPKGRTFTFVPGSDPRRWRSDLGEDLVLVKRTGAIGTVSRGS